MSAADEVHSDTDDDGYYGHSPSPPFSPSRPEGDDSSHIDTENSSAYSFSANEDQDVESDDETRGSGKKRIPERVGNFKLLTKHKLDIPPYPRVAKWVSEKSGLKVVWADTPVRYCSLFKLVAPREKTDQREVVCLGSHHLVLRYGRNRDLQLVRRASHS